MSKIKAKYVNLDPDTLKANGDNVQIMVKPSNPIAVEAGVGLALQPGSVDTAYLKDSGVTVPKIAATNSPSNGQIPVYDSTSTKVIWTTPASTDSKDLKVSANDASSGFLNGKLVGTANKITLSENSDGSSESLQVNIGANVFDKTTDTALNLPYTKSGWTGISTAAGALDDLKTNKADDSNAVHKTTDETIAGNKTFSGNSIFNGNVTINGTTTSVNSTTVSTGDNIIELNNQVVGAPTTNSGIKVIRGSSANATIIWNETTDKWSSGIEGSEVAISYEGHTHSKANVTDFVEANYVHVTGNETVAGIKTFNSIPVLPASDPVGVNDATRKSYVDGKVEQKKVEVRTLIAGEITAKQITLASTPKQALAVEFSPKGGCEQVYGDDFTVSGAILTWNGLGLDGILIAGDKVVVSYTF